MFFDDSPRVDGISRCLAGNCGCKKLRIIIVLTHRGSLFRAKGSIDYVCETLDCTGGCARIIVHQRRALAYIKTNVWAGLRRRGWVF